MPREHKTQAHAVRAALREVERRLLARQRVCVQMHQGISAVTLFDVRGGKRVMLERYRWTKGAAS